MWDLFIFLFFIQHFADIYFSNFCLYFSILGVYQVSCIYCQVSWFIDQFHSTESINCVYCNDPKSKFSDRLVWTNSVDPDPDFKIIFFWGGGGELCDLVI